MTVAVSALSGCTTVPRPPAPGPSAAPSLSAPEREDEAETQIVQAPAREALQLIEETSRRPEPVASATGPAAPPAAAPEPGTPQPGHRDVRPRPARPEHPEPARRGPQRAHAGLPDVSESVRQDVEKSVPKGNADICALGRRYGGWRADSPEATICRDTYGR
ncbi:hypothetical protein C1J00_10835 [Streptomyces cahuitamycinicus]|uniref:Uncharacterized protein n=1 Tax=Streptomyces cahuitamycinicus TaxID=2070367 RepID=A0A2N8TT67_9ACTN|nr:hypothetical protein C1J00_10835 [Streptomyces cahuitamycinicus]